MESEQRGAAAGRFHVIATAVDSIGKGAAITRGMDIGAANIKLERTVKGIIRDRAEVAAVTGKHMPRGRISRTTTPAVARTKSIIESLAGAGVSPVSNHIIVLAIYRNSKNTLGLIAGEKLKRGIQGAIGIRGRGGVGAALEGATTGNLDDGKADAGRGGGINNQVNGGAARNCWGGGSQRVSGQIVVARETGFNIWNGTARVCNTAGGIDVDGNALAEAAAHVKVEGAAGNAGVSLRGQNIFFARSGITCGIIAANIGEGVPAIGTLRKAVAPRSLQRRAAALLRRAAGPGGFPDRAIFSAQITRVSLGRALAIADAVVMNDAARVGIRFLVLEKDLIFNACHAKVPSRGISEAGTDRTVGKSGPCVHLESRKEKSRPEGQPSHDSGFQRCNRVDCLSWTGQGYGCR